MKSDLDVVIIGSGPNGLSAGIYLVSKGLRVLILEAASEPGGGTRTAAYTLPGFKHDVCSAVHPMGYWSPYWRTLPLGNFGLKWIIPEASAAHPMDDGPAVLLKKSLDDTANLLNGDAGRYRRMLAPFLRSPEQLLRDSLKPLSIPEDPLLLMRFGLKGIQPAYGFARRTFREERARALFAGCAAHSVLSFDHLFTSAVGLLFLVTGHMENWALPEGGSSSIHRALHNYFLSLGGEIRSNHPVRKWSDLPAAKKYLFNTDPRQLADIAADQLPKGYRKRLNRYRYGPGVFKRYYALSGRIPWKDPRCLEASTVHVGGTLDEIAASEQAAWRGQYHGKPFVMLSQQSQFDPERAPAGQHTGWAYCHVPHGSDRDMTDEIEGQLERFAPGFRDLVLARHKMNSSDFYQYNNNYVGGAITGGAADWRQLFSRPLLRLDPYRTAHPDVFIGSASSPPGGGVHGMGGYYAAKSVLRSLGL